MIRDLKRRIGARIRAARARSEFTQEQLAERIDRTVEAVSNIERGISLPSVETLERLGRELDVPLKEFFEDWDDRRKLSPRRIELEARLRELTRKLSDGDLEIALGQIALLTKRGSK